MIQETSINAQDKKTNETRRALVFTTLWLNGEMNNNMIAKRLNLPINCITGRTRELVKNGHVEEAYKDKCPFTGKNTIFWRIVK